MISDGYFINWNNGGISNNDIDFIRGLLVQLFMKIRQYGNFVKNMQNKVNADYAKLSLGEIR